MRVCACTYTCTCSCAETSFHGDQSHFLSSSPLPLLCGLSPSFARQVQKYVLAQYAAILPNDAAARKAFMQTGLLQRVQELKLSAGPKVAESISRINAAFPTECVKFSDPSYARELVSKLEE
jgi:hypothetical protein